MPHKELHTENSRALSKNKGVTFEICNKPGFPIAAVSSEVVNLLGYGSKELAGKRCFCEILGQDVTEASQNSSFQNIKELTGQEWQLKHKNGSLIWTSIFILEEKVDKAKAASLELFVIDISHWKDLEFAYQEQNEKLKTLMNATPDIICFKDGQGRWLEANDAMLDLYSLKKVEYAGKTIKELAQFVETDLKANFSNYETTDEEAWTKRDLIRIEEGIRKSNGELKIYDVIKAPLFHKNGVRKGLVLLGRDITDKKRAEATILKKEKFAAVGQLASGLAHDFNNILTGIIGCAELINSQLKERLEITKLVSEIIKQTRRAAKLIRQILDFSQKTMRNIENVELDAFVRGELKNNKTICKKNIEIEFEKSIEKHFVKIDQSQLQQGLTNVFENAIDAMPSGGKITIRLTTEALNGTQYCSACKQPIKGKWHRLDVVDAGAGIPENIVSYIFEPYFTTKNVTTKSGLGLAQLYGIVAQAQGHVIVKSRENSGTTFSILFPVITETKLDNGKRNDRIKSNSIGKTILLVEDEPAIRKVLRKLLELAKFEVIEAPDGEMGLEVYLRNKEKIDLVLSDLVMPKKTGLELYKALKLINPKIKMVVMSGYSFTSEIEKFRELGILAWLEKPMMPGQLENTIKEVLAET